MVARFRGDLSALCAVDRDRLLVAVSGGGDSVALLLLAHAVLGERCLAATVDHGLRAESAAEAAFVAELCRARGISHRTLTGVFPARAEGSANLSARARALRYALLEAERERVGAAAIATAHHGDDQIETLVMRLNRGSGVGGLAGVRARSGVVIRPLLAWRRSELAAVAAACGIEPVDDPTNHDDRFDRARIRKSLTDAPWVEPAGWQRSAAALADAADALDFAVETLWRQRCTASGDGVVIDVDGLPFELRRRLVIRAASTTQRDIVLRGGQAAALVARLERGESGMVGDVLVTIEPGAAGAPRWRLAMAPARSSSRRSG
ncbi:tRNA lysidine(34) synthetase TilS [Sphingomonas sp.]|uniref:tRNA lysidine(34) synthetase TilS n=1 Tax=Sphingomonas sp. TaxID=28214 RepID=UPI002BC82894|nr:tRNA lysidine(34) synthetase TilS [Sphingomonas sp.]HTG38046.1 tRNA lysidine(34) synthetase TilS [Sphingomonas sp.]